MFSADHYWFISVDSVGRERSKLFQVVVLILEAAITLTFQVFERGLDSEPVGGEILFGVGGVVNEFQAIISVHRLSSCTTERDIERNDKVCQKFIGFISK